MVPGVVDSAASDWKPGAPSTRTSAPVSGIMSTISWRRIERKVSVVWFGMMAALVNCEKQSLTTRIFCVFLSITSAANLDPKDETAVCVQSRRTFGNFF